MKAIERHPDWILGVKVLASASHTGAFGLEATKLARKAAELTQRPLMVHVGNAPPVIDDVLELMGPVLRHRMALSFAARAEGITIDDVIGRLSAPLG